MMISTAYVRKGLVASGLALAVCIACDGRMAWAGGAALQDSGNVGTTSSDGLLRDASGRVAYIIELAGSSAKSYPADFVPNKVFKSYQKGNVVNLIQSIESQYDLRATGMTSWSSTSLAAYLDEQQYEALSKDPRVVQIVPDVAVTFSDDTSGVWVDSAQTLAAPPYHLWNALVSQPSEMIPWGKSAMNQSTAPSNGSTVVYIVDAGVGQHADLNVVEWVNATDHQYDCGTRTGVSPPLTACTAAKMSKLVGCYAHATAVAGIVGAKANGAGIVGINPGAKIVSVSVLDPAAYPNPSSACIQLPSSSAAESSRIKMALDWIYSDIVGGKSGKPSVVNLSMNWEEVPGVPDAGISAVKTDMANLAAGTPGAFVVQSAGNKFSGECRYAYSPTSSTDGIMVVGAINAHGQPVVPLNGAPGFWRSLQGFGHTSGSNYGPCVEAWAPGDTVFTTAAPTGGYAVDGQQANTVYTDYGYGAGTSFAAPHVAGLASYLIETGSLPTAADVERSVRATFMNLGSADPWGYPINLPTISPLPLWATKNKPYAEFVVARRCIWPNHAVGVPPVGCTVLSETNDPSNESWAARNFSSFSRTGVSNVWLAFDSYGTGTNGCDLKAVDTLGGVLTFYTGKRYYSSSFPAYGPYLRSTACPSAGMTFN